MIRWEFVSEMRLNSVSPSLDTSEIMKSTFIVEGKERGGGGRRMGRRSVGIEFLMVEGHIPGQMLRASETITLICKGHSSILHAKYNAVAITRYGFVLRNSTLI